MPVRSGGTQVDPLGHTVGRQFGRQPKFPSQCEFGVGAMHRRLVHSPPDPPSGRLRPDEGPHLGTAADVVDGVEHPLRPGIQPVDGGVGVLGRLAIADLTRVQRFVAALVDDLRAPSVATADVLQQLDETPAGAGRHGHLVPGGRGTANHFAEGLGLLDQGCSEVHPRNVPRYARAQG
jgi:hypothetical protein